MIVVIMFVLIINIFIDRPRADLAKTNDVYLANEIKLTIRNQNSVARYTKGKIN
jgi:hypothetical protein